MTAWGKEAIAAYIGELEARGLEAREVLVAVRTWPAGSDFPPSAPNLAAAARRDPSKPTFDEAIGLIRAALRAWNRPLTGNFANEAEMLKARAQQVTNRTRDVHPLVAAFIHRRGIEQLQKDIAELGDDEWGGARRAELRKAWEEHCEAFDGREAAALVAGRRGQLGQFDPLAVLNIKPERALPSGGPTEGVPA
jgi:hypothetical protein